MTAALPLAGVRVLDIGVLIAGPFAATMLGDFGAEVIKVEQPGVGDALRGTPRDGKAARSSNWLVEGRNKKSVTLNLRVAAGQDILRELVQVSDVLIENFTPGTLERWNLGWEDLRKINPRLIMVRVSGYGQTGPYSKNARATTGSHSAFPATCTRPGSRTAFRCVPPSRPPITIPAHSRRWRPCSRSTSATHRTAAARDR